MKKFNHGAWFSLHKMTNKQKQWCLDNLDWWNDKGKDQCVSDKTVVAYYFDEMEKFGSNRFYKASSSKELTFEDLYYEKGETKPMNLEKYSVADLRRIRDNIDGLLAVVDEIKGQAQGQESEESVRGFDGLGFTKLGSKLFISGTKQRMYFVVKRHHTQKQLEKIYEFFPLITLVVNEEELLLSNLYAKIHFNDLFQYKTEEVKS